MIVRVARAVGHGPTNLAAFDAALVGAGVADRNLILLSSVLPAAARVVPVPRVDVAPGRWGDRLYCVAAHATTGQAGAEVWAGIGWVQDDTGRGLLVEHDATDETSLRGLVGASLDGLCTNRSITLPTRGVQVAGAVSDGRPTCALVVAVFQAEAWAANGRPAGRVVRRRTRPALVRRVASR